MSNSQLEILKYIAILFMVFDHYSAIQGLGDEYRIIGRIVFPLFAFILVYNFIYNTKDKKKYILRLFLFTLISQPIYYYAFEVNTINIFGTLTLGLLILYLNEMNINKIYLNVLIFIIVFPISFFIDYKFFGIFVIIAFYYFLKQKDVFSFSLLFLSIYLLNFLWNPIYSMVGILALFIIYYIRTINVDIIRINKWFFYLFYPIHLLVIKVL